MLAVEAVYLQTELVPHLERGAAHIGDLSQQTGKDLQCRLHPPNAECTLLAGVRRFWPSEVAFSHTCMHSMNA